MDEDDIRMSNDGGDESFLEMIPALAAALGSGVGLLKGFGTAGAKLAKLRKLKPKTEMEKELVAELEKIKEEYGNLNVINSICGGTVDVAVVGYFREEGEEKSVILF